MLSEIAQNSVWILSGLAAGSLLFLAASELLPRIHGNLKHYGTIWHSAVSILLGFAVMSVIVHWSHETFGHGDELHDEEHVQEY
jgi:zinc transporter ZupT